MRKVLVLCFTAVALSGYPASALEIIVTNNGDAAKIEKVTISDPENDVERGFEEDDGTFVFETDEAWMRGRGIVEAVIDPERSDDPLHLTASLYSCVAASDCTTREIVLPEFPEFFAYKQVPDRCGSQAVTNNFGERLEKYLYCRAAYRWFEARNLADAENWPSSSFALGAGFAVPMSSTRCTDTRTQFPSSPGTRRCNRSWKQHSPPTKATFCSRRSPYAEATLKGISAQPTRPSWRP